jgi:hypothetical protein
MWFLTHTVGDPNLSPIPYRTVSYHFPLEYLSRSRSLSARRTVFFCLKFPVFPLKKSKARRENGCITQELLLITFQFSNFHIHFLSHKKIIPPNKLVHFILTDWLDQDDMLTAKKALTNRRKGHSSIHQQNEQLLKKGLKPLDVKMIV